MKGWHLKIRSTTAMKAGMRSTVAMSLVACALASGDAHAQDLAREEGEASSTEIQDIVVTGTKRGKGEVLQEAAVSATALGENQIRSLHASNISDLGATAPNVQLRPEGATVPGTANFFIRGTGVVGSVPSDDPAVAVVVDGVPLGTTIGVLTDTFDLEGVEIYRGPQGTLFGRNATGGAVVLRSRRPSNTFGGRFEATLGAYDQVELSGSIEGPLTKRLNGKVAVLYKDRDGYLKNVTVDGRQGDLESVLVRPMLQFDPGTGIDITLIGEYGQMQGDGPSTRTLNSNIVGSPSVTGKFETAQNFSGFSDIEWHHLVGEVNIEAGSGIVTSITAYRELDQGSASDADGLSGTYFNVYGALAQHQFTQELRWSGDIGEFGQLTAGAFYFDQRYSYQERRQIAPPFAAGLRNIGGGGKIDQKAAALFAEVGINLSPGLELVLGGRYTYEKKDAVISIIGVDCPSNPDFNGTINFAACAPSFAGSKSWNNFTPKFGLNYKISPDAFAYASWSRGFRSGGFNVRSTNPAVSPGPYRPEKVDAYEAGLKLDLLGNHLRINTAAFYNKFTDLQRTAIDSQARQTILNAASATIWGVESEISAKLTNELTVNASTGYTNAKYDSFNGLPPGATRPVSELLIANVPEWTFGLGAQYRATLQNGDHIGARIQYSYIDKVAHNDINTLIEPSHDNVDASISYEISDHGLELSVFGKNIFNVYYNVFSFKIGATTPGFASTPATYGVRASLKY